MVMRQVAFVLPNTSAIFVLDGTAKDFIHHELFHLLLGKNQPREKAFLKNLKKKADKSSDAFKEYRKLCEKQYGKNVSTAIIREEIACDLCEYAMSGSLEMYGRLKDLFTPEALEALCENARKVFAANRTGKRVGEGNSQIQPSSDRNPRYYLEESAETNAGDVNKVHNLQAEKSAPSSVDGNSGGVNNIHTGEMLASLREAGAYEGLSLIHI